MEDIGKAASKAHEDLEKIKEAKPVADLGIVKDDVKWTSATFKGPKSNLWWLDESVSFKNTAVSYTTDGTIDGYISPNIEYVPEKSVPITQKFSKPSVDPYEWMKKQQSSYSVDTDVLENKLIATVTYLIIKTQVLSIGESLLSHGKEGHAIVFKSSGYFDKDKAYVWWSNKGCWVNVDLNALMDHWAEVQKQNQPKSFDDSIFSKLYAQK